MTSELVPQIFFCTYGIIPKSTAWGEEFLTAFSARGQIRNPILPLQDYEIALQIPLTSEEEHPRKSPALRRGHELSVWATKKIEIIF